MPLTVELLLELLGGHHAATEGRVGDGDRRVGSPEPETVRDGAGDRRHGQPVLLGDVGRERVSMVHAYPGCDPAPLVCVDGGHVDEA